MAGCRWRRAWRLNWRVNGDGYNRSLRWGNATCFVQFAETLARGEGSQTHARFRATYSLSVDEIDHSKWCKNLTVSNEKQQVSRGAPSPLPSYPRPTSSATSTIDITPTQIQSRVHSLPMKWDRLLDGGKTYAVILEVLCCQAERWCAQSRTLISRRTLSALSGLKLSFAAS